MKPRKEFQLTDVVDSLIDIKQKLPEHKDDLHFTTIMNHVSNQIDKLKELLMNGARYYALKEEE